MIRKDLLREKFAFLNTDDTFGILDLCAAYDIQLQLIYRACHEIRGARKAFLLSQIKEALSRDYALALPVSEIKS